MTISTAAKERKQLTRETLGKALYDLGKLAFAGLAIGSLMQIGKDGIGENLVYTATSGIVLTFVFFYIGNQVLRQAR